MEYQVSELEQGMRIDKYLMNKMNISRNKVQKIIQGGHVLVNEESVKNGYIIKINDLINIEYIEEEIHIKPELMDLNIVYEDDDIIVVNKDNGMVVHPAIGNNSGTLVNGLMAYSNSLSSKNGNFRLGIVHRIDAYTTGLLMVAKNDIAHDILAEQLAQKTVHRVYVALVWGIINNDTGTIDAPIGRDPKDRKKMVVTDINSKDAVTHFKVLERFKETTLIELRLETGRTHQIRVHMNYIGYPIVNDPVYGRKKLIDQTGQCLHAKELGFIHPKTKEYMEFNSELPPCFTNILSKFK
ncbi:MAG: RluA family pseudouridine synthase [Bacilli bacterium]|nr:RluA family pseudouridine synthase [Bacilli bacterium]MDD4809175.1 RluA family pseudouridine synthase [Bacilli bacterium]